MKMKKVTAMSMAVLMAASMIPSVPVMAAGWKGLLSELQTRSR